MELQEEQKEPNINPLVPRYHLLDYDQWQRSKKKTKWRFLPQIKGSIASERQKGSSQSVFIRKKSASSSVSSVSKGKTQSRRAPAKETEPEKIQANTRILKTMLKFRLTSLEELKQHVASLTFTNQELAKKIQDLETSTTEKVRKLLYQENMFGIFVTSLEYATQKQIRDLKNNLQQWEAQAKVRLNELQQQLAYLKTKIRKTQEELNFLSTYMDQEYPVKSVQIANLVRQIENVKRISEEELEDLEEMRKEVLQTLSKKLMLKAEQFLYILAKRNIRPYQAGLMSKTLNNQQLLKQMVEFRLHIEHMKKELPTLKAQVETLKTQRKDPREMIFDDVLLRKPKCTPDMDIILNIPQEELLPF